MPLREQSPISAEEIIKRQSTIVAREIRDAAEKEYGDIAVLLLNLLGRLHARVDCLHHHVTENQVRPVCLQQLDALPAAGRGNNGIALGR